MFSKEQFTTVTPLSKGIAIAVFIVFPFVAFFVGTQYGQNILAPDPVTTNTIEIASNTVTDGNNPESKELSNDTLPTTDNSANIVVDFDSCVEAIGKVVSVYEYQYCEVPDIGRFTKSVERIGGGYELQTFYSPYPYNLVQKIIQNSGGIGVETIIISNIADAIGEPIVLKEIAFWKNDNKIYFTDIVPESDVPPGDIYELDVAKRIFNKLEISKYYRGYGSKAQSNYEANIAVIPTQENENFQKLFFLDLVADKAIAIVTLSGDETLSFCMPGTCLGESYGEIAWISDYVLEYAVYDMRKTDVENTNRRALIERRQIQIP